MTVASEWWRWTTAVAVFAAIGILLHQYAAFYAAMSALGSVPFERDVFSHRYQTDSINVRWRDQHDTGPMMSVTSPGRTDPPAVRDHVAAGQDYLARHPGFRRHLTAEMRSRVRDRYDVLFDSLHLTPAEADAFQDVQLQRMWINVTGPDGPLGFCVASPASQGQVDQQLTEVLGEERFRAYQEFERKAGVHFAAHQLVMGLYFTDEPLTSDHCEQVVQVLAESNAAFRDGKNASRFSVDWEEARTRAAAVLSTSQLAVFERIASREEYVQVREAGMPVRLPSPSEMRASEDTVVPAGL